MRILVWHVHGSWATAFVQGDHTYLIPTLAGRGPDGGGRPGNWDWPTSAVEVDPIREGKDLEFDMVVLQRPHELGLVEKWFGRRPGRDVPAVFVEHNAPQGRIAEMVHPFADREDITIAHVTHFNDLFWDAGRAPTVVIEHGIVDPGYRYSGELPVGVAAINEAARRGRVTGTDLLPRFADVVPVDLFGIDAPRLGGRDVPQWALHDEMARRRVYVHPFRWTSLGLTLLEAMHLGMPVVAVATTEAHDAIPPGTGVVSNRWDVLTAATRTFVDDPEEARRIGKAAREHALTRYGLARFLADWDALLTDVGRT